jgi:N-acetylmuramoyl-L-alanine amidase CwlA
VGVTRDGLIIAARPITPNRFSRPQLDLLEVRAIVLHWVANPKTDAKFNRDWFDHRQYGQDGYGSAHYVVDDHRIVQCIPYNEVAYHAGAYEYTPYARRVLEGRPNYYTIAVELCHPDWGGRFNHGTLVNARLLVGALCMEFGLGSEAVTTHNAITGKECPRWFVEHPEALGEFRDDVAALIRG